MKGPVMSLDFSMLIPRPIYDEYHRRFDNDTYRAFGERLARHTPAESDLHARLMNWLIDSSFERLHALPYRGAGLRLATALLPFNDETLFVLAERHLVHFTTDEVDRDGLLTLALLHYIDAQVGTSQILASHMHALACDHHRWTGRVAFYWLTGIVYLLMALRALLQGDTTSYVQEKYAVAVGQIASGLTEATLAGLRLKNVVEQDGSSD